MTVRRSRAVRFLPLVVLAASLLACAARDASPEPFGTLSLDETERMMREPGVVVVDANSRTTFEKNRLPGALHYKAGAPGEVLPADRDARLVFYCASPS